MRKCIAVIILLTLFGCLLTSPARAQRSLEELKASLRAQVRSEMGMDSSQRPSRQASDAAGGRRRSLSLDNVLNSQEPWRLKLVFALVVIALIPAVIAKTKGRSFVAWWTLGMLLFIVALPASVFMKPISAKTGPPLKKKKNEPDKEEPEPLQTAEDKEPESIKDGSGVLESSGSVALDVYEKIERISALKNKGVLSEEEFNIKKNELLDRI